MNKISYTINKTLSNSHLTIKLGQNIIFQVKSELRSEVIVRNFAT